MQQEYYLGIMSGTSLDGVDIALMAFAEQPQFIVGQFTPMPTDLRQDLLQLVSRRTPPSTASHPRDRLPRTNRVARAVGRLSVHHAVR